MTSTIVSSGHVIIVMSGDVRFDRIEQVKIGANGGRLIEVVSSHTLHLTRLNSLASDNAKTTPKDFQDPLFIDNSRFRTVNSAID